MAVSGPDRLYLPGFEGRGPNRTLIAASPKDYQGMQARLLEANPPGTAGWSRLQPVLVELKCGAGMLTHRGTARPPCFRDCIGFLSTYY